MSAHASLARSDPVMARLVSSHGRLSFETRRRGRPRVDSYGMLLRSVVGQQVSAKAAATIYDRVLELFGGRTPTPAELLAVEPTALRGAGLSGRKIEYIRDLAHHVESGELELDRLAELSDEEVIAEISAIRGFGVWSAQMFLMFQLERPDVLPTGDLGHPPRCPGGVRTRGAARPRRAHADRRALAAEPHPRLHLPLGNVAQRPGVASATPHRPTTRLAFAPGCRRW